MALTREARVATSKIAGLTVMNAMVFQEVLAGQHDRVITLRQTLRQSEDDLAGALSKHWRMITKEIDYYPIFNVASELLEAVPASKDITAALKQMAEKALVIVGNRAALRHDLMGRVYHRLLVEAKYLGTYYTSVSAATLLMKLALDSDLWDEVGWSDLAQIQQLRIADLACGTGTLLMATAEATSDNYVRSAAVKGEKVDLTGLHRTLMESVLYGFDVLPSALQLTASTLALRSSGVGFDLMNLFSLPLGGPDTRLGSIEFLNTTELHPKLDLSGGQTLFQQVSGSGDHEDPTVVLPPLDLCVMNPPFVRSVGGNLLFGSLPKEERAAAQKKLKTLLADKRNPVLASATAGLAAVFIAVGDRRLREGGRMALVLPRAILSGVAWEKTRTLLSNSYELEHIIVSHDPDRWNFSDNTELSEVLLIARKVGSVAAMRKDHRVIVGNLWKSPTTVFESLSVARSIQRGQAPDIATGQGGADILVGSRKVGEAVSIPWSAIRSESWLPPVIFGQSELLRVADRLAQGKLYVPGSRKEPKIPLVALGDIATLGPDRRDIYDGFEHGAKTSPYPAFWGNDTGLNTRLQMETNDFLTPLSSAKPGRSLRKANDLWPKAGRILILEKAWMNTARVIAVRLNQRALSNVWWPVSLMEDDERFEKALVLWLNSTLGLISLVSGREETRGSWMGFKKPTLSEMPVLDPKAMTPEQLNLLARTFDEVSRRDLEPMPSMGTDSARAQMDDAISKAFAIPSLTDLRKLLGREPIISLSPLE